MKAISLLTLLALISTATAEDVRKWTESASKRVVEGKIVSKKADRSQAQIELADGRRVWIKTATLTAADQDYIKNWISSDGILTARVVASGKGWKRVKVDIVCGSNPIVVKSYRAYPRGDGPSRTLKPGERDTFTYKARTDYYVVASCKGKEIDRESHNRKTGL